MNSAIASSSCLKTVQTYYELAYDSISSVASVVTQFASRTYVNNAYAIEAAKYLSKTTAKILIPVGIGMAVAYITLDRIAPASSALGSDRKELALPLPAFYSFSLDKLKSLRGVTFKTITYTNETRPLATTWTKHILGEIKCPNNLHMPEGLKLIKIDANHLPDHSSLIEILNHDLQVDHLVLINVSEDDLMTAQALSHIKNLEIQGPISEETVLALHQKHQNIAAFILPHIKAPDELKEKRLVIDLDSNNCSDKFKEANKFWEMVSDNLAKAQIERQTNYWNVHFPENSNFPVLEGKEVVAAVYTSHLLAFKESKFNKSLKHFAEKQPRFLPFLRVLDLSKCENLLPGSIRYLTSLHIYEIILNECPKLICERSKEKTRLTSALTCCIKNGTERIRLKDNSKIKEDLQALTELDPKLKIEMTDEMGQGHIINRGQAVKQMPGTPALEVDTSANSRNENLSESGVGSASQNLVNESLKVSKDNLAPAPLVKEVVVVGGHDEGSSQTPDKVDGVAADKAPAGNT